MSSLLMIEPHQEGHHMRYVCWVSGEAIRLGYDVRLALSAGCLGHPSFLALRNDCGGDFRTTTLPVDGPKPLAQGVGDLVRLQARYRKLFAEFFRRLPREDRPDHVFVPHLDYCSYATAIMGSPFGDTPWGGLIINPTFHLSAEGIEAPSSSLQRFKERAFYRLLGDPTLRMVLTLDETLVQRAQQVRPGAASKLAMVPEPAELLGTHSRESARRMLGIPADATIALVYGALDASKGIDSLLAATEDGRFPREVGLLLAGPQDTEVRALLSSPRAENLRRAGRLYDLDKYVHGEDEHAVFRASDLVWIGYRRQYISSGVLIQAGMAGLPVVACDEGLIGWLTRKRNTGLVVHIEDARAVAKAVSRLTRDPGLSRRLGDNGRRYAASHNVEGFSKAVGRELAHNFPRKQRV